MFLKTPLQSLLLVPPIWGILGNLELANKGKGLLPLLSLALSFPSPQSLSHAFPKNSQTKPSYAVKFPRI